MDQATAGRPSGFKIFGALAVGLTAIGFSPILVKIVTHESAFLVAAVRTVLAVLFLLPAWIIHRRSAPVRKVSAGEHLWVAAAGIMLGLHLIAWVSSIYFTSIASASVLVTTHPVLLIVFERVAYKYRFAPTVWAGVLVAFFGSMVLGYADHEANTVYSNPVLGNSLALLAAVIFAVYFLIGNRVRQHRDWLDYVFPVYGYAAATALAALLIVEGFSWQISGLLLLAGTGLALGPQITGHGALNYAVKYVSPTLLSTLILLEPAISSVMAFLLFSEVPSFLSFTGMTIIMGGITLTWFRKRRPA